MRGNLDDQIVSKHAPGCVPCSLERCGQYPELLPVFVRRQAHQQNCNNPKAHPGPRWCWSKRLAFAAQHVHSKCNSQVTTSHDWDYHDFVSNGDIGWFEAHPEKRCSIFLKEWMIYEN